MTVRLDWENPVIVTGAADPAGEPVPAGSVPLPRRTEEGS
ncbi:hypothetical protein FHX46_003893 [Amycolatopsis viridis]|uniref:Uncharacterized protein n=1 Tax=Amycolatopsis viridis TaxID=185678 RepID=A0ABX0SWM5_9PSEU|nr:hypothetical protein [Amycolatopsis viridis]